MPKLCGWLAFEVRKKPIHFGVKRSKTKVTVTERKNDLCRITLVIHYIIRPISWMACLRGKEEICWCWVKRSRSRTQIKWKLCLHKTVVGIWEYWIQGRHIIFCILVLFKDVKAYIWNCLCRVSVQFRILRKKSLQSLSEWYLWFQTYHIY